MEGAGGRDDSAASKHARTPSSATIRWIQSSILASPLGPKQLTKREAGYQPALAERGEVDRFMLSLMDGDTALSTIAERSLHAFPNRFSTMAEALAYAGTLSAKYAR